MKSLKHEQSSQNSDSNYIEANNISNNEERALNKDLSREKEI